MTLQEIFDKSVTGIKAQGRLSQGPMHSGKPGTCFYRHPDDPTVRCAIGHLIPDELYNRRTMEGRNVNSDAVFGDQMQALLDIPRHSATHFSIGLSMLNRLQAAHDDACTVEGFLNLAADVARKFYLDPTVCDEVDCPDSKE